MLTQARKAFNFCWSTDQCSIISVVITISVQVTEVFFNGHSNSSLKLIGCEGQLLDNIESLYFDQK